MDFQNAWNKALKNTEIIRSRIQALMTMGPTKVPYILLSESSINIGDTVVRKGEVLIERPALIVPPNNPQFNGFEFDSEDSFTESSLINYLLVRGVSFPSMKYDNKTSSLEVYDGRLSRAVKEYNKILQREENVKTGLIIGPEDVWQFSLLLFVCSQIERNAESDIKKLLEEFKKNKGDQSGEL